MAQDNRQERTCHRVIISHVNGVTADWQQIAELRYGNLFTQEPMLQRRCKKRPEQRVHCRVDSFFSWVKNPTILLGHDDPEQLALALVNLRGISGMLMKLASLYVP